MILLRKYYKDRTEGKIIFPDGTHCYCLERPWLDNKPFVSCIPEDEYVVRKDDTGKHQWYVITNVPNRTAIEMHEAHTVEQLQGCLSPCMELKDGKAYRCLRALEKIYAWYGDSGFVLKIQEWKESDGEF